jgi:uncharacterized protein (DUF1800 family)
MSHVADIAHLLRRTSFTVTPGAVDQLASKSLEKAIRHVVDNAAPPRVAPVTFKNVYQNSEGDDFVAMVDSEYARITSPSSGLGDRMLWFWKTMLTTSFDKVPIPALLLRQHQMMARHALGSFRDMIYDLTIDSAMLIYLDGDYSNGAAPNENYGREVMELFTLGRGNYSQGDVRSAALGFAGWFVDNFPQNQDEHFDPGKIVSKFDPGSAFSGDVNYLNGAIHLDGTLGQYRQIISQIFSLQSGGVSVCAQYIASRLFQYFVHPNPDAQSIYNLASVFQNNGFEIRPLLSALFRHPDFFTSGSRLARARLPIEYVLALPASFASPISMFDYYTYADATGQIPFDPPNVAGWAVGNRWLSASQTLARARLGLASFSLARHNHAVRAIARAGDPVAETLRWTSLYDVSNRTRVQLYQAATQQTDPTVRAQLLLALATISPDYALV